MTTVLAPVLRQKFFDNNGDPLVGGKLFSYVAGTSTKVATYTSSSGMQTNSNPILLDYRGEANVWIEPNVGYKFVLADANDTDPPARPISSVDQVKNAQLLTLYGGVDTGSANNYVLNFTASFIGYTDGIVIYWLPSNTNTGASTVNVNGLGPVALLNADGSPLLANQIIANTMVTMIYRGTGFYVTDSGIAQSRVAFKPSSTDRALTTTLTADPDLQVQLQSGSAYEIKVFILFTGVTTGTQGLKYLVNYSGAFSTLGSSQGIQTVNATPAVAVPGTLSGTVPFPTIVSAGGIDGVSFTFFANTLTAGMLSFDWSQNSSSANATRVITGSYLSAIRINE